MWPAATFPAEFIRLTESYTNQIVGGTPLLTLQRPFLPLGTGNIGAINISFARSQSRQPLPPAVEPDAGKRHRLRDQPAHQLPGNQSNPGDLSTQHQPTCGEPGALQSKSQPFPRYQNVVMRGNGGSQNYNALEINLERRLRAGLHFQGNWVLAKNVGNVDDDGGSRAGLSLKTSSTLRWSEAMRGVRRDTEAFLI